MAAVARAAAAVPAPAAVVAAAAAAEGPAPVAPPPPPAATVGAGLLGLGPGTPPTGLQTAPPPAAQDAPVARRDASLSAVVARLAARAAARRQQHAAELAAAAVPAAAAAAPAAASVVAISIDAGRPSPADIAQRETLEDEDFSDKDPRRFNFRRAWSSGDDDVVAATDADNWSSVEFRTFVWNNADGRGDESFQLIGTRDLANEFDPAVPAR
jgi:hypothetical protein